MKNIIDYIKTMGWLMMALFIITSCSDEEEMGAKLEAAFTIDETSELEVGYSVKFVNESKGSFSYLWSFGDGEVYIGADAAHVYSTPGNYTVTLESNGNGKREITSQSIEIGINNSELYFIDNDNLQIKKIVIGDPDNIIDVLDLPGFSFGLAFDEINEEFYFSDDDNQAIYKNNLTGTAEAEVASGFNSPRAIALDIPNGFLYVSDRGNDEITKVQLSNGATSTLYNFDSDPDFYLPVGLDLYENNLYASAIEIDSETIWKGDVNGSVISRIIDYNAGGYGYGVKVDRVNDQIYFDDNDGNKILRANLDGSNVVPVGTTSDRVYGISIFNEIGTYYFVGRDGILYGANLDGSNQRVIKDLGVDVRGLILRKVD